ncbi:MAG: HD domain-containing protein, partial [Saprospiraceae bacterium]|nr:HD domain-containing protein [Saprospiraceae bacterium]
AEITREESEAASIAILLHDIGHGPFSHALEGRLVSANHEELSLQLMRQLNDEFGGRLTMAIQIFQNEHPKHFLHQLISGQLDLDRMDYLNRDSFYTGVMEGKIGYDRIIKMFRVVDDTLMVEEKGLASIEKFLVARKIMYWQVYLHKTVLSAERMLIAALERARFLHSQNVIDISPTLSTLLSRTWSNPNHREEIMQAFVQLDDIDIMILLKNSIPSKDFILGTLSLSLIQRRLFKVELSEKPIETRYIDNLTKQIEEHLDIDQSTARQLVWSGEEQVEVYNGEVNQIKVYKKDNSNLNLSEISDFAYLLRIVTKYYLCYPHM